MIRLLLLFFSLVIALNVQSQRKTRYGYLLADSSIISLTSNSKTQYIGIDNRFILNTKLINGYDTVIVKCNNGPLYFDETYLTLPKKPGNLRLEVHGLRDTVIDTIGYFNFKVLRLPTPQPSFNNIILKDNMKIPIKSFLEADSLQIIITDDIPNSTDWIQIKEFSIGYSYGSYFVEETSKSNIITQKMKKLVKSKGANRVFSIKVMTQSASLKILPNPIFKVFFY